MKISKLIKRIRPLFRKCMGKTHTAPWHAVGSVFAAPTFRFEPPQQNIREVEEEDDLILLRFGSERSFWFPRTTRLDRELWGEYLFVFWDHPANFHYYLRNPAVIEKGDVVIDLGACEGAFAKQALEAGARIVVCVEPTDVMTRCLRKTYAKEISNGSVVVVQAAIGLFPGRTTMAVPPENAAASTPSMYNGSDSVPIMTLGEIMDEAQISFVNFVKADIEGAELGAIEGALPVLKKFMPRLSICTYHKTYHFVTIRELLRSVGYSRIRGVGLAGGVHSPEDHPWLLTATSSR